jgi:hypothetical protein
MGRGTTYRRFPAAILAALLLQLVAPGAGARKASPDPAPRQPRGELGSEIERFAKTCKAPICILPNGKRVFTFIGAPRVAAREKAYLKSFTRNVIELSVSPTFHHLYVRLGDQTYDNWPGSENGAPSRVNVRRWSTEHAGVDRVAVLAELPDKVFDRVYQWIEKSYYHPRETLGMFRYGGGDPRLGGARKASNCTSWISCAPVGDRGETLAELLGVRNSSEPNAFLRDLVLRGNDRVKGVCVFNPTTPAGPDCSFLDRARWTPD